MKQRSRFRFGLMAALFFLSLLDLVSWMVMWLWNWILPGLTGVGLISFEKALGLLVLCRLLFGRWGGGKPGHSWKRGGNKPGWMNWSPEERARMQAEWKQRCAKD